MTAMKRGTMRAVSEQTALLVSLVGTLTLGVLGVVWGLAVGSQLILLDGVYGALGVVLSGLSLQAARLVAIGPTSRFPFGREALAPLVVAVQGVALGGICAYAIVASLLTIVHGGSDVAAGWALIYAAMSAIVSVGIYLFLRPPAKRSDLVHAEAVQWLSGVALEMGMIVAFAAMLGLQGTGWAAAIPYVDPALVLVACVLIMPAPVRMLRTTVRELLEGAPPEAIQTPVRAAVAEVTADVGLDQPLVRMAKLGSKLYVEVDYLVEAGRWDTAAADRVRHALYARLAHLPYVLWLNVELTTDPSLIE
jgi:predicted Co/Zn/Cd cation transporter (cation efflux family)